ncbi:MAG TPA: hypothetical protein VFC19_28195 [Candidatus Limnocylindrales bacterium]|nr:hypothetical protein [Candidatus Limnocylindrales bacterium]
MRTRPALVAVDLGSARHRAVIDGDECPAKGLSSQIDLARSSVMSRSQVKVSPAATIGRMNLQIAAQSSGPASLINMNQT